MTDEVDASPTAQMPANAASAPVAEPNSGHGRRQRRKQERTAHLDGQGVRHTRIGAAWAAVAAITVLGVALVDFIVENTHSVQIHFFSASGRLPVAAALLAAALAGAAVVLAVGVCRTAQLRLSIRHRRRAGQAEASAKDDHAPAVADKSVE
jgi:uncharacterized integral membrane protein